MNGQPNGLLAKTIGAEVADLFQKLVRDRLREIIIAQVDNIIDEALKDLPGEVRAAIAMCSDPLGHHVLVDVKAGRLP